MNYTIGKITCIHITINGASLKQFDYLAQSLGSMTNAHLEKIVEGLSKFIPKNVLCKQNTMGAIFTDINITIIANGLWQQ